MSLLTILDQHTENDLGMCAGCRALWHRLIPYPCTQVVWARAVLDQRPNAETTASPEAARTE
jgi:hypothetical protein